MQIKIIDTSLAHLKYEQMGPFEFDYSPVNDDDKVIVFTDHKLHTVDDYSDFKGLKIAWLIEPKEYIDKYYCWMINNYDKFDYVLTHHKCMLYLHSKFFQYTFGGCWVPKEDQKIHIKNKLVSIIASNKNFTSGQKIRHKVVASNQYHMDTYGLHYNYIENKADGLKDYAFSVAIENVREDYFFTEKLIDCFLTGTIPIYWGCPSIGDYFDKEGMIICNSKEEIDDAIRSVNMDLYNSKIEHIENNFVTAKNHGEFQGVHNVLEEIINEL